MHSASKRTMSLMVRLIAPAVTFCSVMEVCPPSAGEAANPSSENKPTAPLVLKVRVDNAINGELVFGNVCSFSAEMHNISFEDVIIYMPGLVGRVNFKRSQSIGARDERGFPEPNHGRGMGSDPRNDYLLLQPGDYYGRVYDWDPPAPGKVTFSFSYNAPQKEGPPGLAAWRGIIENIESPQTTIKGGKKALDLLCKMIESKDPLTRGMAARKMAHLGESAVPILLKSLDDSDKAVSYESAFSLQCVSGVDLGLPYSLPLKDFTPSQHISQVRAWAEERAKRQKEPQKSLLEPERESQ